MRLKRVFFVGTLIVLFLCCYQIMNQHYDELARYQYVTDENRKIILEYLSTEDISYLIDRQYKPEEFMDYLKLDGFNIRNVDWYEAFANDKKIDSKKMMVLVDKMKEKHSYTSYLLYTENYSFKQLYSFYLEEHAFIQGLNLVKEPMKIRNKINDNETLFTYVPSDLVKYNSVPSVNSHSDQEGIYLQKQVGEQLNLMCKAAFEINDKTCGNMLVTQGYTSYVEQEDIYEEGLLTYGIDEVLEHVDYPGQSIFQLGNVIRLVPATVENQKAKRDEISIQQKWLMEHAFEYGFEFVSDSSMKLDEFILQFNADLIEFPADEEGVETHD